jgi:hypothetical protein
VAALPGKAVRETPVEVRFSTGQEGTDDHHASHPHEGGAQQSPSGRANSPPHPNLPADASLVRKANDRDHRGPDMYRRSSV